jgi:hypothetical protein
MLFNTPGVFIVITDCKGDTVKVFGCIHGYGADVRLDKIPGGRGNYICRNRKGKQR